MPTLRLTDFLVLAVLSDAPQHGYALAQAIAERSGQRARIRAGDLYRVLYRMARAGLIEAVESGRRDDDERRQYYGITAAGRRAAREEAGYLGAVCADLLGRRAARPERTS
jgi:DNA-binding PadR family transcriptional regulator